MKITELTRYPDHTTEWLLLWKNTWKLKTQRHQPDEICPRCILHGFDCIQVYTVLLSPSPLQLYCNALQYSGSPSYLILHLKDKWEEQDISKSRALMQMWRAVFTKLLLSKIWEKPCNLHVLQGQYTVDLVWTTMWSDRIFKLFTPLEIQFPRLHCQSNSLI